MNIRDMGELHLVEDNREILELLSRSLHRAGYVVYGYESADHFLATARINPPCVLVLDMRLPKSSGVEVQQRLAERGISVPTVFISGQSASDEIIQAFRGGAVEFLWKPFPIEELTEAIARAMAKSRELQTRHQREEAVRKMMALLSPREREILPLLVSGHSNKRIAAITGVQPDTAKKHKANILDKLGFSELSELVSFLGPPDIPTDLRN